LTIESFGQPEIAGEHSGFAKPLTRMQVKDVAARGLRGLSDGLCGAVSQPVPLGVAPEMIHRIQFRCRAWEKTDLNLQFIRQVATGIGRMLRSTVFKEDAVPAAPMCPDHAEKVLMRFLCPLCGDQRERIPTPNVQDAMQHALGPIAGNRNAPLLSDLAVTTGQRRRLQNERFVEH